MTEFIRLLFSLVEYVLRMFTFHICMLKNAWDCIRILDVHEQKCYC